MRAFVALEVPGGVLDSLAEFQKSLSSSGADIKLVERVNLHFTIKFLGEISEAQAAEARSRLEKLNLRKTQVEVKGAGAFPSLARPRVVWAGVSSEHRPSILELAQAVIDSLEGIGERDERPFQAHITVARVRSGRNVRQLEAILRENSSLSFGIAELADLKLKSSQLTPSGPIYEDMGVYPLG